MLIKRDQEKVERQLQSARFRCGVRNSYPEQIKNSHNLIGTANIDIICVLSIYGFLSQKNCRYNQLMSSMVFPVKDISFYGVFSQA